MSLRRFYPPCFLSIGAEDHDTWLPPEMYLEHLSDNHIPKAGIGHLLDRPVEIRWWHLLADPDRMTCQGQDRCTIDIHRQLLIRKQRLELQNVILVYIIFKIVFPIMPCLASHLGEYAHQA